MTLLGNLIWIICGGLLSAIGWLIVGFKIAKLALCPFGAVIKRI